MLVKWSTHTIHYTLYTLTYLALQRFIENSTEEERKNEKKTKHTKHIGSKQ